MGYSVELVRERHVMLVVQCAVFGRGIVWANATGVIVQCPADARGRQWPARAVELRTVRDLRVGGALPVAPDELQHLRAIQLHGSTLWQRRWKVKDT